MTSAGSTNVLVKNDSMDRPEPDKNNMPEKRRDKESAIPMSSPGPTLWNLVEIFVAETLGTGMLMYFGCMSQIVWKEDAPIHPWQGPVVFAVLVATIIQIFGQISAAHLNPAVSVCFLILGKITPAACIVYILAECTGAILGFGLLKLITPCDILDLTSRVGSDTWCSTIPHPGVTVVQAIGSEFFATSMVILVVCGLTDGRNANYGEANSLKFAATILALSITVSPYTGASMNPARSLGPVVWNGHWDSQWIYWFAPMLSGLVIPVFYQIMFVRTPPSCTEQFEDLPLTGVRIKSQKEGQKERT